MQGNPDAVVVGAGPNGLAAALRLSAAGLRVRVVEAAERPGGGMRTEELMRPGLAHDVCSIVQPTTAARWRGGASQAPTESRSSSPGGSPGGPAGAWRRPPDAA